MGVADAFMVAAGNFAGSDKIWQLGHEVSAQRDRVQLFSEGIGMGDPAYLTN